MARGCTYCAVLIGAVALSSTNAQGAFSLSLGSGSGRDGALELTLSASAPVGGFTAAAAFDGASMQVTHIDRENRLGGVLGAELVAAEIYPGGFVLQAVMDVEAPFDGRAIPAGTTLLARIEVRASARCGAEAAPVLFELTDGKLGAPPVSNAVMVGNRRIGVAEGLVLEHGRWTLPALPCGARRLVAEETRAGPGAAAGTVRVLAQSMRPLQGFVLSLANEPAAKLAAVSLEGTATAAAGAEFVQSAVYPTGGTLGVVLDFEAPFDGHAIPMDGEPVHIASFLYFCPEALAPNAEATARVTFVDDVFGAPPLRNLLVEDGLGLEPERVDGAITFTGAPATAAIDFLVNADNVVLRTGECADVGFFYRSPLQQLQGVSLAVCYDARLGVGDILLGGSVTAAVNAEFVEHHAANGELIVGILVDATPPAAFDRLLPATESPLLLARVRFCDGALAVRPGECLPLRFCDGARGAGSVPIANRAVVFNGSLPPRLHDGTLCAVRAPRFLRGDCHFDGLVDVADAPAILCFKFLRVFTPPCLDACDANDDGTIDIGDSLRVVRFLFAFGAPPPLPGPFAPGADPTVDLDGADLGCDEGRSP